jgi:tetratricopeptide (TPR) repeat protein
MITSMRQGNNKLQSWNMTKRMLGCLVICAAMNGLCVPAAQADEDLSDLAGRIEYAYYAADGRSLQQSLDALEHLTDDDTHRDLVNSYLNYGRWKLSQLVAKSDPDRAQQAADACADSKATTKQVTSQATHHALVAACLEMLGELRPLRKVLYRSRRDAELTEARQIGAVIAQVQFISAWITSRKNDTAEADAALKQALTQFDQAETAAGSSDAGWGHAEAAYLLGKSENARGNVLAARNALEQALVLAPDYREAQQLLRSLTLK